MNSSEELTSRQNEDEIPKVLKRLEMRYSPELKYEAQALDTVLATNMISVGVDVDRLGLMLIVTQPKGTAEYIQASSRVGRSTEAPGLVFTLYNASRPRDRSHYEHFRGFHEAFYRYVEPTSVTPFSPPAMERALHAVLVIAARHISGLENPARLNREDPDMEEFLGFLRERAKRIDPDHIKELEWFIENRLTEWEDRDPEEWGSFASKPDDHVLMRPAGGAPREDSDRVWETPTSMRNVDVECSAAVVPRYYTPERNN